MLAKLISKIQQQDQFGHIFQLNFNQNVSFKTLPGGFWSIILRLFYFLLFYLKLNDMFYFKQDQISQSQSFADYTQIGTITLEKLEQIPMYALIYQNKMIHQDICGDHCFEYIKEHLNLNWFKSVKDKKSKEPVYTGPYESRLCTEEEVGEFYFKRNLIWICPPKNKLELQANKNEDQYKMFEFKISPNYKSGISKKNVDEFVSNIIVNRYSKENYIMWDIHKGAPYTNETILQFKAQLEIGKV